MIQEFWERAALLLYVQKNQHLKKQKNNFNKDSFLMILTLINIASKSVGNIENTVLTPPLIQH